MRRLLSCATVSEKGKGECIMNGRHLREALHRGERVYGISLEGYGQPRWPRYFAGLGLDYVFIDSEHTPQNRETIAWAAQAYAAWGVAPLVRIPGTSAERAAMVMDAGAHGVIVPYVETVEQVRAVVGAVKYRPLKGRAQQAVVERGEFPNEETRAYLQAYNLDSVLVIMIESPAGVEALPDLLAVEGVDAVLIGPHDFSISHGLPEQYDHPTLTAEFRRVIDACRAREIGVGIVFIGGGMERALRWADWGCNMVCQRGDTLFVMQGIEQELAGLRAALDGRERHE
jgi:2-keto-3-deoxy-L-rhamnonate aldolase RhmA